MKITLYEMVEIINKNLVYTYIKFITDNKVLKIELYDKRTEERCYVKIIQVNSDDYEKQVMIMLMDVGNIDCRKSYYNLSNE